jgi:hypothetical protein
MFRLRAIDSGRKMNPTSNLSFTKITLVGYGHLGVESRGMGPLWLKALVTWEESFWWLKASMIGGDGPCPFSSVIHCYLVLRVFENRVLWRIFGLKRDDVTGEWRKLYSEELHILYSSPSIIRQIKSRRMRWAGHVARMGEECVQCFDGKARRKETT